MLKRVSVDWGDMRMLLLHRRYDEYERLLAGTRVLDRDLEGAILDVGAVVSAMVVRLNEIGYTHLSILI